MTNSDNTFEGWSTGPGIVVPRNPTEEELPNLLEYLSNESDLISFVLDEEKMNALSPTGIWTWDEYQLRYLECDTWYIANKTRQSGMSTAFAAKAFGRAMLVTGQNYTGIFTSYKKEEAINKINYIRQFLGALPPTFRKEIIRDPLQLIEWRNADGTQAKVLSHAQKPIRGINGDIFLDELAFYQFADQIYESALPAVGMVRGTVDIVSTPFGKGGKFYEIFDNSHKYAEFHRAFVAWWHCRRYLKDDSDEFFLKAFREAPGMSTEDRVNRFGNRFLKMQFESSTDVESFQQEFEGHFVDEQAAFFNRKVIMESMYPAIATTLDDYLPHEYDFEEEDGTPMSPEKALAEETYPIISKYDGKTADGRPIWFHKFETLDEVYEAVLSNKIGNFLVAGADIGTTRHSTHFVILEEVQLDGGETLQIERFSLNRQSWDLKDQEIYFDKILLDGFVHQLHIDATGIGMQMGQTLKGKWPSNFEDIQMGGSRTKQERLMTNLKSRLGSLSLALAFEKETIEELYAINRKVSAQKTVTFHADEKKRHHADRAWAIAMASLAGTPHGEEPIEIRGDFGQSLNKDTMADMMPDHSIGGLGMEQYMNSPSFGLDFEEMDAFNDLISPGAFIKNFED